MKKFLKFLDHRFEEIVGVVLLSVVIVLIFVGVVLRLVFHSGMPEQEELSRILYVIMVFMGASYGLSKNDHIRVTFLYGYLNDSGKKIMRIITDAIWVFFHLYMIYFSIIVFQQMSLRPAYSSALNIGLHTIFATVPVAFSLMTFRIVQIFVRDYKAGDLYVKTS
jgi:C4-dicarboxylate transporter DctQ subunit